MISIVLTFISGSVKVSNYFFNNADMKKIL